MICDPSKKGRHDDCTHGDCDSPEPKMQMEIERHLRATLATTERLAGQVYTTLVYGGSAVARMLTEEAGSDVVRLFVQQVMDAQVNELLIQGSKAESGGRGALLNSDVKPTQTRFPMDEDTTRVYVVEDGAWWSFTAKQWVAFFPLALAGVRSGEGYELPNDNRLKGPPKCVSRIDGEEAWDWIRKDIEVCNLEDWDLATWEEELLCMQETGLFD